MTPLSLVQRLWLSLLLLLGLGCSAILAGHLFDTHEDLETQLSQRNAITAQTLALLLSQPQLDAAGAERVLDALFQQGQYSRLSWNGTTGLPPLSRQAAEQVVQTPAWLHDWLPLQPKTGIAQVNRGWLRAGRVEVESAPEPAYQQLWLEIRDTLPLLLACSLLLCLLAAWRLWRLQSQLRAVVAQAHAVSEQRFIQIPLPKLPELAAIAAAMNQMVERLQQQLGSLRQEVEKLRQEKWQDPATGLPNRASFEQQLASLLDDDTGGGAGYLLLLRLAQLPQLNQRLGGHKTDALIKHLADELSLLAAQHRNALATRLRGADFALLCPEISVSQAMMLADEISALWAHYPAMALTDTSCVGHIGIAAFSSHDSVQQVLERASQALAQARSKGDNDWHLLPGNSTDAISVEPDWRKLIKHACRDHSLQLQWNPVRNAHGRLQWQQGTLQLPASADQPAVNAGRLLSHALRLELTHLLDLATLRQALVQGPGNHIAVNFSPSSLAQADFLASVQQLLASQPERSVCFEFQESGLSRYWQAFLAFNQMVRGAGHRVAVEVRGDDLELITRLNEAGINYLVLDCCLTRGIHADHQRQALLRSLLQLATLMGVFLQAKGINNQEDVDALIGLGVYSLTGPAIH